MTVLDSSAWLAYFAEEPHADGFATHAIAATRIVPTIVLHEVYKVMRRERNVDDAMEAVAAMTDAAQVVPLTQSIALFSADLALQHGLSLADAVIYATTQVHDATLITSDAHFEGLRGVEYLPKP